jgi:hypothetical protein
MKGEDTNMEAVYIPLSELSAQAVAAKVLVQQKRAKGTIRVVEKILRQASNKA